VEEFLNTLQAQKKNGVFAVSLHIVGFDTRHSFCLFGCIARQHFCMRDFSRSSNHETDPGDSFVRAHENAIERGCAACTHSAAQVTLSMEYMEGKVGIVFNPEKVRGDIYDAASSIP
jgi:hypothetical protein